ncbi:hypothetical protein KK137_00995 [Croceibacterium sp. LX-88]|uniref:Integrase n=1 Tax=Croceibacterium selenioxidans TaxID=2838833 RepID=A0ABS5VZE4_9SPHN|nr:hypothetical protein [Croceibacterium selenioxidans]MBT2132896.1 hypothetical protein [Croceibacterium selenioxidans]
MTQARPPARPARRRVPAFYPVPVRGRRDGWTRGKQAAFLGLLAETGTVLAACERVGMSRKSAYKLRQMPGAESFAAAWDAALGLPVRKVTVGDLAFLAYEGLIRPRMHGGRYVGWTQTPDNSALLRLNSRLERMVVGRYPGTLG